MTDISNGIEIIRRVKPTLVSTFELLVKAITPVTAPGTEAVARTVVQGYFLTIANTSNSNIAVTLQFTATTPELNLDDTVVAQDASVDDEFQELVPTSDPRKFTHSLKIAANDTALVTLLPDVTKTEIIKAAKLEIRGYVEISLISASDSTSVDVLLTPEHRGTFLPQNLLTSRSGLDFDQLAYSLPTSTGGSLFTLTAPVFKIAKELKIEVKEFEKVQKDKDFEKLQAEKVAEINQVESLASGDGANDLRQLIGLMAERLDQIEQRTANGQNGQNGQSFIQAKERPNVGQQVVNQPRN
ncbi:hypothetical protein H1Q63_28345 [Desmonostoc muscorum CCALA 125]|nr:hypothetical protein [Desmonostoc muscorum CCALA 125]